MTTNIRVPSGRQDLPGDLTIPPGARGLVGVGHSDDIGDWSPMHGAEKQTLTGYVAEGGPAHRKHLIVLSSAAESRPGGSCDQLQFYLADSRVAHAQDVRQARPVGGERLLIGLPGGKVPVPESPACGRGFVQLAQQESIDPRNEVRSDVPRHHQRRR